MRVRLNRVACGVVAGTVGILAASIASVLQSLLLFGEFGPGRTSTQKVFWKVFWIVFVLASSAVFWFADWLGILSAPYERSPSLLGREEIDANPDRIDPLGLDDL